MARVLLKLVRDHLTVEQMNDSVTLKKQTSQLTERLDSNTNSMCECYLSGPTTDHRGAVIETRVV